LKAGRAPASSEHVFSKILLFCLLALGLLKFVFRFKLRELGPRIDRLVNALLIAIVLVYSGQIVWWLVNGRD
jgi:hypothetical protein